MKKTVKIDPERHHWAKNRKSGIVSDLCASVTSSVLKGDKIKIYFKDQDEIDFNVDYAEPVITENGISNYYMETSTVSETGDLLGKFPTHFDIY